MPSEAAAAPRRGFARLIAAEPHEFYVVVPATPVAEQEQEPGGEGEPADRARAVAAQRLTSALAEIRGLGAAADGEVGDRDPVQAVRLALRRFSADEIVVSTLRRGASRWLRADLPSRVERSFGLPVEHVVGGSEAA